MTEYSKHMMTLFSGHALRGEKIVPAAHPAKPYLKLCPKFASRNGLPGQACYILTNNEEGEGTPAPKKRKYEKQNCTMFPCCTVGSIKELELTPTFYADTTVAAWLTETGRTAPVLLPPAPAPSGGSSSNMQL